VDASFVPPEGFNGKRWYRPVRLGSAWFYHRPEPLRPASFMRDYSTVDPQIRGLVAALHAASVPTMPSCSGHWPDPAWSRRCHAELLQDLEKIRNGGLEFLDVESGQRVWYRNPFYSLPWADAKQFQRELTAYNGLGYLAFVPPASSLLWNRVLELNDITGVRAAVAGVNGKLGIEIRVRTGDPASQAEAWKRVRSVLRA